MRWILSFAVAALFTLAPTLVLHGQVQDWTQWRGSGRDGKSAETGLLKDWPDGGPPLLWRSTGNGGGYSSFAASKGRLYTLGTRGSTEYIVAIDAETGKKVWETPNGSLFSNDRGNGPRGTPVVDGDRLFALGGNGDLACLDLATGAPVWKKNILREFGGENPYWGISESPLVLEDRLLVQPGGRNATVVALNKTTGAVLWKAAASDPAAYSSAVVATIDDVRQAIFFTERNSMGLDLATGKILWTNDRVNNGTANIATPIVNGNKVFLSSAYGTGAILLDVTATGATQVYFTREMMNHHASSVLIGEHLYGFSNSILTAMRFSDGKVGWKDRSVGKGSLIYADSRLYLFSEQGQVALAEATPVQYVEHGRFRISTGNLPTWSHPIITNGKLILRDQGTVYAYDITAK
jgi:outer membrane protein assembly factor BamB